MPAGHPPIFKTAQELQDKIDAYVESLQPKRSSQVTEVEEEQSENREYRPLTISGLAYYLGFESRQSFYDYEKREEFSYTIKRARLFIESQYEQALHYKNCVGSIFALKNMGWDDRQQIKHEGIPEQKVTYLVSESKDD